MEDLDGVEADGELAGEGHQDEEHVQQQEGAAVLAHHHLEMGILNSFTKGSSINESNHLPSRVHLSTRL